MVWKKKMGHRSNVKHKLKKLSDKALSDSFYEITITDLDGNILFNGHQDSTKAKRILEKNPNAIVIKGVNNT